MDSVRQPTPGRRPARQAAEVRDALRTLGMELTRLNHQVSGKLGLRDVDLDCLNLLSRLGPQSPGNLARHAGLHPATMTGVLDRLEKAGWITRDRDPGDRRAVRITAVRERGNEVFAAFSGMNRRMDEICGEYTEDELSVIAGFLRRAAVAGDAASQEI
jgi:DNA-binding MarR family transcriptional regulator